MKVVKTMLLVAVFGFVGYWVVIQKYNTMPKVTSMGVSQAIWCSVMEKVIIVMLELF